MSSDKPRNINSEAKGSANVDSIIPRRGMLPATIKQLSLLRLKQPPPDGVNIVIIFRPDGSTTTGITTQNISLAPLGDIQRANGARALAREILGNKKKREIEENLAISIVKAIGTPEVKEMKPTANCVTELRRIDVELDRVRKNVSRIEKIVPAAGTVQIDIQKYIVRMGKSLEGVLASYADIQLHGSDLKKEQIALNNLLLHAGIPRAIYNKLSQPNLFGTNQVNIEHLFFGTRPGAGMKMSRQEICSNVLADPFLRRYLGYKNSLTLAYATSNRVYQEMILGLNEAEIARLDTVQLTMVSANYDTAVWQKPQPQGPIPHNAIGKILLEVNKAEIDYHSGILPFGTRAYEFWSKAVSVEKTYPANLANNDLLKEVVSDSLKVTPNEEGVRVYPRDHIDAAKAILLNGVRRMYFVQPPKGEVKVDDQIAPNNLAELPARIATNQVEFKPKEKAYLGTDAGKAWFENMRHKVFLKTYEESSSRAIRSSLVRNAVPQKLYDRVKARKMGKEYESQLVEYLQGFSTEPMMEHAYGLYVAELQRLESSRQLLMDPDSEEDDTPEPNYVPAWDREDDENM